MALPATPTKPKKLTIFKATVGKGLSVFFYAPASAYAGLAGALGLTTISNLAGLSIAQSVKDGAKGKLPRVRITFQDGSRKVLFCNPANVDTVKAGLIGKKAGGKTVKNVSFAGR